MATRTTGARSAAEQLDLFAEVDAAEKERRFNEAPKLFNIGQRGYFARLAAFEQWVEEHGHFDSFRGSHAWHAQLGSVRFGAEQRTSTCRPTILTADLRCDHSSEDCFCMGDLLYRGACLHCEWEGSVRDCENSAVEDAHDHAWPGWRDLPLVGRRPEAGTSAKQKQTMARWVERINDRYPTGWLETGGPIRTTRRRYGTRHVPNHTGFGGYDLCGEVQAEPA
jgi:hypothetical protein